VKVGTKGLLFLLTLGLISRGGVKPVHAEDGVAVDSTEEIVSDLDGATAEGFPDFKLFGLTHNDSLIEDGVCKPYLLINPGQYRYLGTGYGVYFGETLEDEFQYVFVHDGKYYPFGLIDEWGDGYTFCGISMVMDEEVTEEHLSDISADNWCKFPADGYELLESAWELADVVKSGKDFYMPTFVRAFSGTYGDVLDEYQSDVLLLRDGSGKVWEVSVVDVILNGITMTDVPPEDMELRDLVASDITVQGEYLDSLEDEECPRVVLTLSWMFPEKFGDSIYSIYIDGDEVKPQEDDFLESTGKVQYLCYADGRNIHWTVCTKNTEITWRKYELTGEFDLSNLSQVSVIPTEPESPAAIVEPLMVTVSEIPDELFYGDTLKLMFKSNIPAVFSFNGQTSYDAVTEWSVNIVDNLSAKWVADGENLGQEASGLVEVNCFRVMTVDDLDEKLSQGSQDTEVKVVDRGDKLVQTGGELRFGYLIVGVVLFIGGVVVYKRRSGRE